VLLAGCGGPVARRPTKTPDPSAVADKGQAEVNQQRVQGQAQKPDRERFVQTLGGEHMNKRCKHVRQDGFNCGSYAFNLYKDDIDQGDLCDVHYWQAKAQRTWVGLTDEEAQWIYDNGRTPSGMMEMVEAKLKERNNA
jgi:hypothetical protein